MRFNLNRIIFIYFILTVSTIHAQNGFNTGVERFNSGDYKSAIKYFEEHLKIDKSNIAAYEYLAQSYLEINDYNKASSTIENALLSFPDNHNFLLILTKLHASQNKFPEALCALDKLLKTGLEKIKHDKLKLQILLNESVFNYNNENKEKSLKSFKEAQKLDPLNEMITQNIIAILLEMRNYIEAESELSNAIKRSPKNLNFLKTYGGVLLEMKKYDKALKTFEKLYKLDSGDAEIGLQLALLYRYKGKVDEAIIVYEELLLKFSDNRKIYEEYISYYNLFGNQGKIREIYQRMLLVFPEDLNIRLRIAETYKNENKPAAYRDYLFQLKQTFPANPKIIIEIARSYRREGLIDESLSFLELEIINSKDEIHIMELASLYIERGNFKKALEFLYQNKSFIKDELFYNRSLAAAFESLNEIDSAKEYYRFVKSISPGDPEADYKLAILAVQEKEFDAAINLSKRSLENSIKKMSLLQSKISSEFEQQPAVELIKEREKYQSLDAEYEEVYSIMEKNMELLKRTAHKELYKSILDELIVFYSTAPFLLIYRAEFLEEQKDYKEAINEYNKTLRISSNFTRAHIGLGRIYHTQGFLNEALIAYKRVVSLDHENIKALSEIINIHQTEGTLDNLCDEWLIAFKNQRGNKIFKEKLIEALHKANRMENAKTILTQ